ncbi:MAG: FAD-binding protein [Chloroflexi bacterium]|nr:FAD-binding protein [Chloroflexota bacterium]
MTLTKLFEPGKIGGMQLRNRIIMAPMGTLLANKDGTVSERLCRYYEERAKGGVALIIIEITAVAREGRVDSREIGIYDDKFLPGLKQLVDCCHRHGAKVAVQLHHAGRQTIPEVAGGQPVAPSSIPSPAVGVMPRELTTAETQGLVEAYGQSAKRAREVGFDAVEVHGAHGYLVCQFLSAYSNKRTDKYGGSLENRARFPQEIVARIKELAGADYPLLFRISAKEGVPDGLKLEETRIIAQRLEQSGVHCLDISAGNYDAGQLIIQPGWLPRGCLVPLAEAIKKEVTIPVSVAGRLNDPVLANQIIEQGKTDFVSLGRPLLADPELPRKAMEGRLEDLRMCTACCHCIDWVMGNARPITCAINATTGREEETLMKPAQKPKKVLVIGAGPGGMEAARVAGLRGHKVTLMDKEQKLGGQLNIAAIPPGKDELATITRFMEIQLAKPGVAVKLGQEATIDTVVKMKPDVVVVATGSSTMLPDISGADLPNVSLARDVISGKKTVGKKVVVVGGGRVGCETADLLASQGKESILVRMTGRGPLAGDMGMMTSTMLLANLRRDGVIAKPNSRTEKITGEGVVVTEDGQSKLLQADSVVLSPAPVPDNVLAQQLKDVVPELHVIGDASKPRGIFEAIHEGYRIASGL